MQISERMFTVAHPSEPAFDMALTAALLEQVGRGEGAGAVRAYRPGPAVAFGRMDRLAPGFACACDLARSRGMTPLVRLGGGRAAAYGPECVLLERISAAGRIGEGLEQRFAELAGLLTAALNRLGVGTELGELPGEYCPGRYSVHLAGGPKVAGIAQRVISGAALTTAVLVVDGGPALREVIAEVYAALGLEVDPCTAGAITDRYCDITAEEVLRTTIEVVTAGAETPVVVDLAAEPGLVARARELMPSVEPELGRR